MLDAWGDFVSDCEPDTPLDEAALRDVLAQLSEKELAALEDDLDFAGFTGAQTPLIREIVSRIVARSEVPDAA